MKLYKRFINLKKSRGDSAAEVHPGASTEDESYNESRVGTKLSGLTTQKVIILVLCMLVTLPMIRVEEWWENSPTSSQYGADVVSRAWLDFRRANGTSTRRTMARRKFERQLTLYIGYHNRQQVTGCTDGWNQAFNAECKLDIAWVGVLGRGGDDEVPLSQVPGLETAYYSARPIDHHWSHIFDTADFVSGDLTDILVEKLNSANTARYCEDGYYASLLGPADAGLHCPEELRPDESKFVAPMLVSRDEQPGLVFVYDLRPWQLRSAVFNMLQTVLICGLLAMGAMVFSHDANVLVLRPIERMISKVEKIRDNPLYAMKLGDETYREQQQEKEAADMATRDMVARGHCRCRRRKAKMETMETKILENAIIKLGKLLALGFGEAGSEIIGKNMDDESATVNAMIPGNRVEAVFGFCDIRSFTVTTEVLQDRVMVFVNQVAEIVHTIVDSWHGAPNRNIGDAFLIVWRMRDDFSVAKRVKMADMSVMSFIKVVAAINKSAVLKDYREHPALLARLPNYRVKMGFGLHYGWAIEGAIGSDFKIDASYISPHVNVCSRMEGATKGYDVPLLVSEPLAELCSPEMEQYFRTIDHVKLKGGKSAPIRLLAVDLLCQALFPGSSASRTRLNYFEARALRERQRAERMEDSFCVHELFKTDPDLVAMRASFPKRFFELFTKAYLNYEAGEWDVARRVLSVTLHMMSKIKINFTYTFAEHEDQPVREKLNEERRRLSVHNWKFVSIRSAHGQEMIQNPKAIELVALHVRKTDFPLTVSAEADGRPDGPSKALLDFMEALDFDPSRATPKGWPGYRELVEKD